VGSYIQLTTKSEEKKLVQHSFGRYQKHQKRYFTITNEDCPTVRPSLEELFFKEDPGDAGLGSSVDEITKSATSWDFEIFDLVNEFGIGFRSPFRIAELDLFILFN